MPRSSTVNQSNQKKSDLLRLRSWTFTSFARAAATQAVNAEVSQPMKEDNVALEIPEFDSGAMRYLLYAPEVCPNTGKAHIQGYVQMFKQTRFNTLKKYLPKDTHIEPANGTWKQNRTYIVGPYKSKDGSKVKPYNPLYKEFGEPTDERARTDLKKTVTSYTTYRECMLADPETTIKYNSGIRSYYNMLGEKYHIEFSRPMVCWLWGDTGCDKSVSVREMIKFYHEDVLKQTAWTMPITSGVWFDGYGTQEVAFFDEFREETLPLKDLLRLLDWDCTSAAIKGGFTQFRPKYVYITSTHHPMDLKYEDSRENIEQLARRCDVIRLFGKEPNYLDYDLRKVDRSDRGKFPIEGGSIVTGPRPTSVWQELGKLWLSGNSVDIIAPEKAKKEDIEILHFDPPEYSDYDDLCTDEQLEEELADYDE